MKEATTRDCELFVPGRLCILGEHTDWIAGLDDTTGYALICATNEGLFARVRVCHELDSHTNLPFLRFVHERAAGVVDESAEREGDWSFQNVLNLESLTAVAGQGGFFSYIAGTAAAMLARYGEAASRSVEIDNYATTLPMQKGLSSSAAICVLVVQALAHCWSLSLSLDEVMTVAFEGESHYTPSQCGRMDQCVAIGGGAVALMTFTPATAPTAAAATAVSIKRLRCPQALHFVVVDLQAGKDTVTILRDLNACFAVPTKTETQQLMRRYAPAIALIAAQASAAIEAGDCQGLAAAMRLAQSSFDSYALPNCPSQLTSPVLHSLIASKRLSELALAVKGVGSQGDGAAQILVADERAQTEVSDWSLNVSFDDD
jgi:galactokinase